MRPFILCLLPFLVFTILPQSTTSSTLQSPPDYPWIIRSKDCGYAHCIDIDFSKVPDHWVIRGSNPDFASLFLLQPMEGPEPGSNPPNCVNEVPGKEGVWQCLFSVDNVRVANSELTLLVPGPTPINGTITVAQVTFYDAYTSNSITLVKNGLFEVVAKTSEIPGACVGIFTQAFPPPPKHFDEQDIEILTAHYQKPDKNVTAGIQLVNWNAFPMNNSDRVFNLSRPFDYDPPSGFFTYSIYWNNQKTIYAWGKNTQEIDIYSSQNPSVLSINNWSDGGWNWSQGPPQSDSVLRISRIRAYYNV